jgi:hypothetical protein
MATRLHAFVLSVLCVGMATPALPAAAQVVGYEISVAQIEAGRVRHLAQRLAKQNVLYQLHLGGVKKSDLVDTSTRIDRVIETLQLGSPGYAVPAPWNQALRVQIQKLDETWGPLRSIATASPYDYLRVSRQFAGPENTAKDPLVIRYFDSLAQDVVDESEKLMSLYDAECRKSGAGAELCVTAASSGYNAMLSEMAIKQAVYIVAGIDVKEQREGLRETMAAYDAARKANEQSPFFAAALSPERGEAGAFARRLLGDVRSDWSEMENEFAILSAGDEKNFDLEGLLRLHSRMVGRIERFTAAMVRYANIAYGS